MSAGTFEGPTFPLAEYRNKCVLMANGKPPDIGAGSFMANKCGKKIGGHNFSDRHPTVFLATWSELDHLAKARKS
jgi:hypothetical protein